MADPIHVKRAETPQIIFLLKTMHVVINNI